MKDKSKSSLSFSIDRILERVQQNTTVSTKHDHDKKKHYGETTHHNKNKPAILYLRDREPVWMLHQQSHSFLGSSSDEDCRYEACYCRENKEVPISSKNKEKKSPCFCQEFLVKRNNKKARRIGHPYMSRASPKRKAFRHTFTPSQVVHLEALFEKNQYLSSSERVRVARELDMTDNQIKTWYQNRRTKLKREITEMYDQQRLFSTVPPHSTET